MKCELCDQFHRNIEDPGTPAQIRALLNRLFGEHCDEQHAPARKEAA